jgi:2-polyprenyl-3-methyl-5-hydroxy-6-metoxy-1,4-benzoquinol methylase
LSEVTIKRFNELLDKFEYYRKNNRILDIGCGSGFFLEVAKNRGWQVFGTEYTVEAIEICNKKEISMHLGKLDPLWFDENFFDIIVSIEVIEHINNPLEELNNIKTILREGGLFYFTTPNFNSIERFILRDKYSVIEYPEHLSYYNSFSIKILLKKIGLKKIKITTTGISLNRLFFKKNRNPNGIINSENKDEFIRESLEKNRGLRFSKIVINFFLNLFGIGNSLKGWYTK